MTDKEQIMDKLYGALAGLFISECEVKDAN